MNRNTAIKAAVAVLVIAGLAFGGYKYYNDKQAAEQTAEIETTEVVRMDLKSTISATGTIQPVDSVEVSGKITARIKEILVKENDKVTKGQTVAILDGKDYEAKRDQAQFKVTNTKAKYNRESYLYSIGAKSQEDFEDAKLNYDTAQSTLEETETDLNETIITAPMDGVVVGEPKTPGTMATQGTTNPTVIMRIADLSKKQIKAKVDETDIGSVKVGQSATFTVDAYSGKTFNAKVVKISQTDVSNSWDTNSSSTSSTSSSSSASVIYYYVTLDVEDNENLLLPAMTARVEINTSNVENALTIPISALKTDTNGSYVIVVDEYGNQENRYVQTGIYSSEFVEILGGLQEGEKVSSGYTAAAKKTTTKKNDHGGPPPM